MIELEINSKKHGKFTVYYDELDHELVSKYRWCIHKNKAGRFYARTGNSRKGTITMHRLIMGFPESLVDHRDRNTLDNTRANLRLANQSQNRMNCDKYNGNTLYKGVTVYSRDGNYRVRIGINNKIISGGYFNDPIAAAKRYNELAIKYHGEFAVLNLV